MQKIEKDWREMTDEEWDKMLEGVDEYIDAFKERLRQMKEIQDEAAPKAVLVADSDIFEKDANLIFSGSKDFWEEFLNSDMEGI